MCSRCTWKGSNARSRLYLNSHWSKREKTTARKKEEKMERRRKGRGGTESKNRRRMFHNLNPMCLLLNVLSEKRNQLCWPSPLECSSSLKSGNWASRMKHFRTRQGTFTLSQSSSSDHHGACADYSKQLHFILNLAYNHLITSKQNLTLITPLFGALPCFENNPTSNMDDDDDIDAPMFKLCRVQYDWKNASLRHMVISNDILVLAMNDTKLRRIDLQQPHLIEGTFCFCWCLSYHAYNYCNVLHL